MRLRVFTRLVAAAGTVLVAAPALGQEVADLDVTGGLSAGKASSTVSLGVEKTYTLKITNNGPSYVNSFEVAGTFTPPAAPLDGEITIGSVAGCTPTTQVCDSGTNKGLACTTATVATDCPVTGTNPPATCIKPALPCKVTLTTPLIAGANMSLSIPITMPVPNPLPTATSACPVAGTTFVRASATISAAMQDVVSGTTTTPTAVTDNPANNTVTFDKDVTPFTDYSVDSFTATPNANEGSNIEYSVTVHNYGPCDATGTFSDFYPPSTITWVSSTGCFNDTAGTSATGTNVPGPFMTYFGAAYGDFLGCDLANYPSESEVVPVGGQKTYTTTWKVGNFPKSVFEATVPVSVDVFWDYDVINGPNPNKPDHSAAGGPVSTKIDLGKNKGCSTGGAGTLLALLPLLGLKLRRRRSS